MTPDDYDAWYGTPRGVWIGSAEYQLLRRELGAQSGATVLDVGCGTGYFTRRLANDGFVVTGIDPDAGMVHYAAAQGSAAGYQIADARALPFADRSFDHVIAITSLCFIGEQQRAVAEMLRVARISVALGVLNRHSLLHIQKSRHGGSGAYRGAHWHTAREARELLRACGARKIIVRSAVFAPGGGWAARVLARTLPESIPLGGFLLVTGAVG